MNRNRVLARTLCAAGLTMVLGTGASALAQEPGTTANTAAAAEQAAATSNESRRRRERRRDADIAPAASAAPTGVTELADTTALAETVESKIVCKNVKPIGSRVARRVCGTEEQWAAANQRSSEDAEEGLRQFRNRAGVGGAGSGPASLNAPAGL